MPAHQKYSWKKIEDDIFSDDRPLDYKEVSEKWNVPVYLVKRRSKRLGWEERKQSINALVDDERRKNILENNLDRVTRIDRAVLALSEALLADASRSFKILTEINKTENVPTSANQLIGYGRAASIAADLARYHHGDLGVALNTLVEAGIIPEDVTPQVLITIEESEINLSRELQKVFSGRVPD